MITKKMVKQSLTTLAITIALISVTTYYYKHYGQKSDTTIIPITQLTPTDYPLNPYPRSPQANNYPKEKIKITKNADETFDLTLITNKKTDATITFKNIDLKLFVPHIPPWLKNKPNKNLEKIALVEREWNRQQVYFSPNSPNIEIKGGTQQERKLINELALARNCLNAGLWEIILTTIDDNKKLELYHGWFEFPLWHYKKTFETINKRSWWKFWHYLVYWNNPEKTPINLNHLRTIVKEQPLKIKENMNERILMQGEQKQKRHTYTATNLKTWKDFFKTNAGIKFSKFIKPGYYDTQTSITPKFEKFSELTNAKLNTIIPKNSNNKKLHEIILNFNNKKNKEKSQLIISGIDIKALPRLHPNHYYKGITIPIGIQTPPFHQTYEMLKKNPPQKKHTFSLLLNEKGQWLNHHDIGIDGTIMHRDIYNPNKVHLYFLAYERQTLFCHFTFEIKPKNKKNAFTLLW